MFGFDQRDRLLRESWSADALAQELYAMFGGEVPSNTLSTVGINPPSTSQVAPIQITTPSSGEIFGGTTPTGHSFVISITGDGQLQQSVDGGEPTAIVGGGGGGGVPVWG